MRKISEEFIQKQSRPSHQEHKYINEPIRTVNGQVRMKKYLKLKMVGEGAYSKCYLVRNIESDSTYVVKIIPKKKLQALAKQKLIYEIKIHKSLSHPNIVYFDHWFEDEQNKYLFMEYCPNGNLEDKLQEMRKMTEQDIKKYVRQIVLAIQYIHTQKVLHRDLKLCNFYLDEHDNIKLGDFGFACQLANDIDRKRETCGTPNYIAPEAISGFGYSFSSDVWGIGVILYRLKYGQCPFEGQNVKATLMNVKICKYKFHSSPKISADLKDLIQKIFNLNYDERLTTQQILSHSFFDEQQKAPPKQLPQKRGFSLTNLFSRQKPKKQKTPPRRGMMQRQTANTSQKKLQPQPKRSNSCQTLKQMKQIFKNKSKQTLVTNSILNTKSDYNSLTSVNTTTQSYTTNTNRTNLQNSINMNLTAINNSLSIKDNSREQNSRSNRLNDFIRSQVNSLPFKQQFKKKTELTLKKGEYLIKQQQANPKKSDPHKKKLTIQETSNKQLQINQQNLQTYSKRYNLPIQLQQQNSIIILHYSDKFIKQIIYEQVSYLIHSSQLNVYSLTGEPIKREKLPKILKHIIQNKICIQDNVQHHKVVDDIIIDAEDYMSRSSNNVKETIQRAILKVPHQWKKVKDGILLLYGYSGKFMVGKQFGHDSFYITEQNKPKIHFMYGCKDGEKQIVEGVVIENYYSAWVNSIIKVSK